MQAPLIASSIKPRDKYNVPTNSSLLLTPVCDLTVLTPLTPPFSLLAHSAAHDDECLSSRRPSTPIPTPFYIGHLVVSRQCELIQK